MFKYLLFFCICSFLFTCKGTQTTASDQKDLVQERVLFLDSTTAATTIIKDDLEHFFDHIGRLDIAIQMQRNFPETMSRKGVIATYQDFLQKDVTDFTESEKKFIGGVCKEILSLCGQVNSDIFPANMWLIKSHGKHYGSTAYYTRENGVVIPKQAIVAENYTSFLGVMLHELFHIYSRLNPEKRQALYQRIGFKKCGQLENLQMNDGLRQRILLNPDGIDYAYAISLKSPEGEQVDAIPLIVSNETQYTNDKKAFFDYIHFDLYAIQPPYSRLIQVKSDNEGFTKAGMTRWPDFHRQIGGNTNYIIHPDEILADNFMHLMMSKRNEEYLNTFTEKGKQLINDIEKILKE